MAHDVKEIDMHVAGWAFTENESEQQQAVRARYKELAAEVKEKGIKVITSSSPTYAARNVKGNLVEGWSPKDYLIYADNGNLCFGGHIDITSNGWSGQYYTD